MNDKTRKIGIVMAVIVVLVLSGAALYFFLRRKGKLG